MEDEKALLRAIVDAGIDLKQLLGDRSFATTDEAAAAIRLLSRAAVELNLPGIVAELGAAAELGTVDPALEGVPDVVPVRKRVLDPTAEAGAEPETVIPFNLEKLREHLARVSFARQVLPGDPAARQKLLEESVLDVAQHRLQREAETLSRLQLGPQGAKSKGLQIWMWEWHQALAKKLKEDVPKLVREERKSDLSAFGACAAGPAADAHL
jgi:DNA-directed RNA polymerase